MTEYCTYVIKRRDGSVVGEITRTDPRLAFLNALFWVSEEYKKAGIKPPAFTTDPDFYAEPKGA